MMQRSTLVSALRRIVAAGLFGATLLGAQTREVETPATTPEELDQRVRILARQLELEHEEAAKQAAAKPSITAGKEGFALNSADGAFVLKLRGYVQVDGRAFEGDDRQPASDTFVVRRARPILEGTVWKIFDFRVMPDFGGGSTSIQDAYVEARFAPAARLRAGKFKPPVGLERLQSATDLTFVERALPTNLVPNRDVGVQLAGELGDGRLAYAVGLFNGTADGGSADLDTSDDKELAARLFLRPFAARGQAAAVDLGLGLAATHGDVGGTPSATGLPAYRSPAQRTFFTYRGDGTLAGTAVAAGRHTRLAPQAWLYSGPFGLLAEWTRSEQEVARGAFGETLEHEGWQLAVSWSVTGERLSFAGVSPSQPFRPGGPGRGALILSARASALEVDDAAFPLFADPDRAARKASAVALGASWDLARRVRLMLDGERTEFRGGAAGDADRETETAFFLRFQLAF